MHACDRIALVTAIAVSSCGVALLVLGRRRLLDYSRISSSSRHRGESFAEHGEAAAASSSSSVLSISRRENKKQALGKKVRFSEDVVEPAGDSAEYRRRWSYQIKRKRRLMRFLLQRWRGFCGRRFCVSEFGFGAPVYPNYCKC